MTIKDENDALKAEIERLRAIERAALGYARAELAYMAAHGEGDTDQNMIAAWRALLVALEYWTRNKEPTE